MKLKELFKGIDRVQIKGDKEVELFGVTSHSQSVAPGDLFLAKKGKRFDGVQFLPQVISAGAVAVVTDLFDPFLKGAVQVIHPDVASLEPLLAARFYRDPSKRLFLVGITGTNGKTTTAYLVRHLLNTLQFPIGLLGNIERIVGATYLPSRTNTPEICETQRLLRDMVTAGERGCVMEVTSHSLVQKRVEGLHFRMALFTNLTQDHLDYHGDMACYLAAKRKLFEMLSSEDQVAAVNADDPAAEEMIKGCKGRVLTYGIDTRADLRASEGALTADGIVCTLTFKGEKRVLKCSLIGRFNVYNCLAALTVPLTLGFTLEKSVASLSAFTSVAGRLERVDNALGIHIFVDYAHTEDALKNALRTLGEFKPKRILTLFGCGGDRDRSKRPKMGKIAEELSDRIYVTSDNPRSEDPQAIIQEILSGLAWPDLAYVDVDRKTAIEHVVQDAEGGDIVFIAGKGHETYQALADRTIPFDDRSVAREACAVKQKTLHSLP